MLVQLYLVANVVTCKANHEKASSPCLLCVKGWPAAMGRSRTLDGYVAGLQHHDLRLRPYARHLPGTCLPGGLYLQVCTQTLLNHCQPLNLHMAFDVASFLDSPVKCSTVWGRLYSICALACFSLLKFTTAMMSSKLSRRMKDRIISMDPRISSRVEAI